MAAMHMLLGHTLLGHVLLCYYIKSVLTVALYTCLWYNLDPEHERTADWSVCKTQLPIHSINNCMDGAASALKDAV